MWFKTQQFPQYITNSRLILFSKTGKEYAEVTDTRPIAVSSHILKIVEKAILAKVKTQKSKLLGVGKY